MVKPQFVFMWGIWSLKNKVWLTEIFVILGHFLPFQPPDNSKNQNFKIEKNTLRYYHFTHLHYKWQSWCIGQALSGDFQRACGKMHTQILLGVQWCAMSIFLCLKFYNFIKGIMCIHSIFKKSKTSVFILHLLTF